jgi:aspartate kinase
MALIVQKYGGTSVGSPERIQAVTDRIVAARAAGDDLVVVVSAMSGETDRLLALAKGLDPRAAGREVDVLLATGEQVTIALLAIALEARGCKAVSYTGHQVHIRTDSAFNKARILEIEGARVRRDLAEGRVVVVAGFQGVDEHGNITTLGRGGSDTTAVAMAAALHAHECQIYTDVDGVYTSDPRIVPAAHRLDFVTYEEMLEMASLGAKVLQIRSVEFARKYRVRLRVLSSFAADGGGGTLISSEEEAMEEPLISGVTINSNEAKLTLLGVPDKPGIASRILAPIAAANIEVDMIVQNVSSEGLTDFTFTVNRTDYDTAMEKLAVVAQELGAREILGDKNIVKLSVVGVGMRSHAGIASRMFTALAREGINIQMISTSEIKISVVTEEKYRELGARVLHTEFGLDKPAA